MAKDDEIRTITLTAEQWAIVVYSLVMSDHERIDECTTANIIAEEIQKQLNINPPSDS